MDHSEVKHLPKVDHTPAELSEDARLLLKAAAIIEQDGHLKNSICSGDPRKGPVCLMGAINRAMSGYASWCYLSDEQGLRSRSLGALLGDGSMVTAVRWNNAEERMPAEVVSKLRAVALGL